MAAGVVAIVCGVDTPRGGGWFRQRIISLNSLANKTVALDGPGAWVLESFGVNAVPLDLPGIFTHMESGEIIGAMHGSPAVDRMLQIHRVAHHLHMPGWQRQAGLIDLIINRETWESLPEPDRQRIRTVCAAAVGETLVAAEAGQLQAVRKLQSEGARVSRWPVDVLRRLEKRWYEIAEARADADSEFAKAWRSLSAFRADDHAWRDLGVVDGPALGTRTPRAAEAAEEPALPPMMPAIASGRSFRVARPDRRAARGNRSGCS